METVELVMVSSEVLAPSHEWMALQDPKTGAVQVVAANLIAAERGRLAVVLNGF